MNKTNWIVIGVLAVVAVLLAVFYFAGGGNIFPNPSPTPGNSPTVTPTANQSPTPTPSPVAQSANIRVFSPGLNQTVGFPFTVRGEARVFENTVSIIVRNSNNEIIYEDFVTANSPDIGQFGLFEKQINYFYKAPTGNITLQVFESSAKDGSVINLVTVPLKMNVGETQSIKTYFNNSRLGGQEGECNVTFPVTRIIPKTDSIARRALEQLLIGPSRVEYDANYRSSIPGFVKINSLSISNGTARVDFSTDLEREVGGSCRVTAIRSQITNTLKQFSTVQNVIISIKGRTEDILQP